jgi:hypothetical protein
MLSRFQYPVVFTIDPNIDNASGQGACSLEQVFNSKAPNVIFQLRGVSTRLILFSHGQ